MQLITEHHMQLITERYPHFIHHLLDIVNAHTSIAPHHAPRYPMASDAPMDIASISTIEHCDVAYLEAQWQMHGPSCSGDAVMASGE